MTGTGPAAADPESTEPVGSVAEEAFKLFRALSVEALPHGDPKAGQSAHVCTTTWCPVCQAVGFVRDNPEAIGRLSESAASFARTLREVLDSAASARETS